MADKTSKSGRTYTVDGKKFSWFPLDDDDNPLTEPVTIPLRIKLGLVREMAEQKLDAEGKFLLLSKLIPGQVAALDEMDLNDFQDMFGSWQDEYEALSGASLGESQDSST